MTGGLSGPLVLASRSPQRRAILTQAGIAFVVATVDVDELGAGPPVEVARANALSKARAGASMHPGMRVLGVDTLVTIDGEILGKPVCAEHAREGLRRLSGRTHRVISGLALLGTANPQVVHEVTEVTFRRLDEEVVRRYVRTGEWSEKAGGYAIQGRGAVLVRAISGDYLNVVGLPLAKLLDLDSSLILRQN